MKKQIIFIHGGEVFDTYDNYIEALKGWTFDLKKDKKKRWKNSLEERLGDGFDIIAPVMPNKNNAKYREWKIWFEKIFPYLEDEVVIIGHSLGGIFISKYLSENIFPKKILATYLISAPYNDKDLKYPITDFVLQDSLKKIEEQSGIIFIYHSEDDPVVPFVDLKKYYKALPNATPVVFKDRNHFAQEEFPELIKSIKELC